MTIMTFFLIKAMDFLLHWLSTEHLVFQFNYFILYAKEPVDKYSNDCACLILECSKLISMPHYFTDLSSIPCCAGASSSHSHTKASDTAVWVLSWQMERALLTSFTILTFCISLWYKKFINGLRHSPLTYFLQFLIVFLKASRTWQLV